MTLDRSTPLALLGLACLLAAPVAGAAEYRIANRDTAGLAGAIRHANASPGADVILLAVDGLYAFDAGTEAGLALPPVQGRLTLVGRGAEIRRNTEQPLALLEVAAGAELDIDSLTLAEGSRGSVRNHGTLRLWRSAIVDGTTVSESAIVQNYGRFEARDSTIGYNQVTGAGRDAGIVLNYGSMRLENCRLAGNQLSRRYPTLAAAPLLNYGDLAVVALAFEDNAIIDGFEGLASAAVLNLGTGHTAGAEPPPMLPLIQP
jgi:hypothetical protein